jgi:hypothetical protein
MHILGFIIYFLYHITVFAGFTPFNWGRRGRDSMVVGFSTTCAISVYHQWSCEFQSRSWRGVLDTTVCDKVCQWPVTGRWFSTGTPVSSTNKTDCNDITEILLKVTLNTISQTKPGFTLFYISCTCIMLMSAF